MGLGLQTYRRDLSLPALYGDNDLVPVGRETLLGWVRAHLLADPEEGIADMVLEHVRYKPHVALTTTYSLRTSSGHATILTVKTHRGAKPLPARARHTEQLAAWAFPFHPRVVLPQERTTLRVWPSDRVLRGLVRVLDRRRTARWLDQEGGYAPSVLRLRASEWKCLRYKPERRAVWRLLAKLRDETGQRTQRTFGLRVVEPIEACRIAQARRAWRACDSSFPAPVLLAADASAGLLLESWLDGEAFASDDFAQAHRCAHLLRRLHSQQATQAATTPAAPDLRLFGFRPALHRLARSIAAVEKPGAPAAHVWIHGDVHPGQLLRGEADALMDWDALRPGCPEEDLASWIAAALDEDPSLSLEAAAGPLLEAYGSTGWSAERLRHGVAQALLRRAAARLQRLQEEAVDGATVRVERAAKILREVWG